MRLIELKIIQDKKGKTTIKQVVDAIQQVRENPDLSQTIHIGSLNLKRLKTDLESRWNCEARSSVSDGCYGARTGKSFEGLTVWMDTSLFPTRYLDSNGDERVNLVSHIEEFDGELIDGLDGDTFEGICEDLGLKVSRNNTYNYEGQSGEDCYFMYTADFAVIEGKDSAYLSIKFHFGGDVRGNYSSKVVYKFGSVDDIHGVIFPTQLLKEEAGA